jgi:hypothetical protein
MHAATSLLRAAAASNVSVAVAVSLFHSGINDHSLAAEAAI